MELVTTVGNFTHDITIQHLAPDTHIRVIIDEPVLPEDADVSSKASLPHITVKEQKHLLDRLPHEANPSASTELVHIIEVSHINTEPIEV